MAVSRSRIKSSKAKTGSVPAGFESSPSSSCGALLETDSGGGGEGARVRDCLVSLSVDRVGCVRRRAGTVASDAVLLALFRRVRVVGGMVAFDSLGGWNR